MGQFACRVLKQIEITGDIYRMSLKAVEIAQECQPGQFVHLRVSQGMDPLLRRPFSIHRVNREKGEVEILYRVVGRGTEMMREAKNGHVFQLMGPLGRGFSVGGSFSHALVVVGGMGSAPVFFLIDELVALGKCVTLLWGVSEGGEIFDLSNLKESGVEVKLATEDGSVGKKGLVTDILKPFLIGHRENLSTEGFVCGPKAMLKRIQEMAGETEFNWQVSLEERMACGVGVCMGCAVKMKQGDYRMVCSDGPVFDLKEIVCDG